MASIADLAREVSTIRLSPSLTHQLVTAFLLLLILAGTTANLAVSLRHLPMQNQSGSPEVRRPTPACPAIPIKFIFEDPQCADKLLLSMNITNVRILSANSTEARMLGKATHATPHHPHE